VAALLAALRYGPAVGAAAGLIAGFRTFTLWNSSFPVGAVLYALEGFWVGRQTQKRRWGPLTATLSFWLLLGGWLDLGGQILFNHIPVRAAFITQARSIINGLLVGLVLELWVVGSTLVRRRGRPLEPARLSLNSLVTLVMATTISLPLLYITASS